MVNNLHPRAVKTDDCVIEIDANGRKKIVNGPVYHLTRAQSAANSVGVRFVTVNAVDDKFNLDMGEEKLRPFILALINEHFWDSERCQTSQQLSPAPWELDCDSYVMPWNRRAQKAWKDGKPFYLKFGFSDYDPKCLVVSIHESKDRNEENV